MTQRDAMDVEHPSCPTCGAPMRLVKVQAQSAEPKSDVLHFECKACGDTSTDVPDTD